MLSSATLEVVISCLLIGLGLYISVLAYHPSLPVSLGNSLTRQARRTGTRFRIYSPKMSSSSSDPKRKSVLFFYTGIFLIIGLSIPVIEIAFKQVYSDTKQQEMVNTIYQSAALSTEEKDIVKQFVAQGGEFVTGRALYPEYLPAHTTDVAKYKYLPAHYPRLSFYLVGSNSMVILMPIKNRPKYFPNASEVVVLGCPVVYSPQGSRRVDALMVGVLGPSGTLETIINRFPSSSNPQCPLPAPGSPVQGNGE